MIEGFHDLADGRINDEEIRPQADYDLWVTDPGWMAHLAVGQAWDTTRYEMEAFGNHAARHYHGLCECPWRPPVYDV